MSTPSKQDPKPSNPASASGSVKPSVKEKSVPAQQTFLFDKENYTWMVGGIALIFIGFLLMSGGKSANPHEFHYDEIYSFRRITLAPIIILMGFGIEVYAIMKKPKENKQAIS